LVLAVMAPAVMQQASSWKINQLKISFDEV
jgi:hypothetical protein